MAQFQIPSMAGSGLNVAPFSRGRRHEGPKHSNFTKKYFLLVHLVTCLDFGFHRDNDTKTYKWFHAANIGVRLVLSAYVCSVSLSQDLSFASAAWTILNNSKHLLVVAIFTIFKPKSSCAEILKDLLMIDEALKIHRGCDVKGQITVCIVLVTAARLLIAAASSLSLHEAFSASVGAAEVLYSFQSYCLDFYILANFFIFYSVYCRLKNLRRVLQNNFNIYRGNMIYKVLVEHMDDIKKFLDIPFVTSLLVTVIMAMINVLKTLQLIHDGENDVLTIVLRYLEMFLSFSLIFAPVILSDLMSIEADNINVVLHNYIYETDAAEERERRHLSQFAWYVSARPFRLRACRVLSLDCTLPVTVLSICVTYLIVVVQFTHLY